MTLDGFRGVLLTMLLVPMLHNDGIGQFSLEGQLSTMIDDNVNNNSLRLADRITALGLQAGYDWETESTDTQLFTTGIFNYHALVPGRTYHVYTAGLTYSRLWGEEQQTLFNGGATVGLRSDREEYAFYDHTSASLYANIKHSFSDDVLGRAGYTMRILRFDDLPAFNYSEHAAFVQASFFLATRTTIILQGDFGAKLYATSNADSLESFQGQRRRQTSTSAPGVLQTVGTIRIGQSLFDGTGLSITGAYQANLQKEARTLGSEYGMISDDDLFDDHYGYEGPMASLMITQLLPWEMKLRVTGSWQERVYGTQPAYDLAGTLAAPHRSDIRRALSLHLSLPLEFLGCSLDIAFDNIQNSSNDPFYSYTNNALTMQISYP